MTGDPSRRPSNERTPIGGDLNAVVWIECPICLGDGWHMPPAYARPKKHKCGNCDGLGARQVQRILLGRKAKIVPAPKGWAA